MLVLLPVCVTDLKEIVMVALPGAALSLSHCSSPAGVWGLLLPFWAKRFSPHLWQVSQMTGVTVVGEGRKSWVQGTAAEVRLGRRGFLG